MIVQGTSVGLDVDALSVVAHAVDEERESSLGRDCARITVRSWAGCISCGPRCGWPMRRVRPASGWRGRSTRPGCKCLVAAPSKLQRPAGDRVKTDARDAAHLARLLRLGEITAVRVPGAGNRGGPRSGACP